MQQGTGTPKVTMNVASGNLQRQVKVIDSVAGIIGTSLTKIGVVKDVYSYDDAVAKGYTVEAEPFLNAQIAQFYTELGGNQKLWIMGVEDTMTLTQMLTLTNANGAKKLLLAAQGEINLLYATRKPASSYAMVAGHFLDKDVEDAVVASKALCEYQQGLNNPIRVLIEGRTNDLTVTPFDLSSASNTYVGVVLGKDSSSETAIPMGAVALGRACKYGAHVKIGNGQNGALSITGVTIGTKALEEFYPEELDGLSDKGYIIVHHRAGAAGYYFGVDNMCGSDDFHLLAHGRLIDKAQRIAAATTIPLLETDVRVANDGTINASDAKYIEDLVKAQLRAGMSEQISGVDVIVDTTQNIITTSTLPMEVKIQPLGYLTWIKIQLGLTQTL